MANAQVPAVAGWFTSDGPGGVPALLGSRCTTCGTLTFPKATLFCPNPACSGSEFDEAPLSSRGTIWSYTDARYKPPPPFVPTSDPFEPFAIVAVHLAAEKIVVLGQVVPGVSVDDLKIGMEVELVIDTLFTEVAGDIATDQVIWKWRPVQTVTDEAFVGSEEVAA
jgi:uncharacterized OB-fold protein